jgi:hypothetical protein
MIEPIMDYIRDQFAKAGEVPPNLKAVQVDQWLREWSLGKMKTQHARVKLHGRILDLQAIFELVSTRFARYVIEEKLEKSFSQGADTILLAGGGGCTSLSISASSTRIGTSCGSNGCRT